ncbi:MAG: S-layer homology domain-containing protein [Candidatus Peregrinibacteria bacterium]
MKSKTIILAFLFALSFFPASALAIGAPTYDQVPTKVDAATYTFRFHTEPGATVTVLGGPADIQPVTDGTGNPKDGIVEVMVGLAQGQKNVFSVTAGLNGQTSSSIVITITEGRAATGGSTGPQGDTTPPLAPILNSYPADLNVPTYTFTGSTESSANVTVRRSDGTDAGSTQAGSQGLFSVQVTLLPGKTNRLNFSAEDGAGNEGPATQAVVRVSAAASSGIEPSNEEDVVLEVNRPRFVDMTDHWAETYIQNLYQKGIVNGKTATRFDPNGEITRAELTKIAVNAFGYTVPATVTEKPFRDVTVGAWYAPYLSVARQEGIASGFSDGFHPNEFVDRAAALKILIEASGLPKLTDIELPFSDVPSSVWFYSYVASAVGHNIVSGYADGTFKPDHFITRAEVSKIVVKLRELLESK